MNKESFEEENCRAMNISESSDDTDEVTAPKLLKLESKTQAKVYLTTQLTKLKKNIKNGDSDFNIEARKTLVNI